MKTLVTSFATDKSGTVSIEHGLAIVDISLGLVVIIGHICRQLNVLSKMVFTAERRRGRAPSDRLLRDQARLRTLRVSGLPNPCVPG